MNLELNKSIEVKRLNKRTGAPTADPEVSIPYGAIVENVESVGDFDRFMYLREMYRCTHTLLASATDPKAWRAHRDPSAEQLSAPASEPVPAKPNLQWTAVESRQVPLLRARVPGGWLLAAPSGNGLTFYPDSSHQWDGRRWTKTCRLYSTRKAPAAGSAAATAAKCLGRSPLSSRR